jgi:endonuclease-3
MKAKRVANEIARKVAKAAGAKGAKPRVAGKSPAPRVVAKAKTPKVVAKKSAPKVIATKAGVKVGAKKSAPKVAKAVLLPHLRERWPRSEAERKAKASEYYKRLSAMYPDAHCALDHKDPYQLLVATILSAQCTDKAVNLVTPALFKHYPDATTMSSAEREELETEIKSTGFFRSKTKSLLGMAAALVERHGGKVPDSMEELVELPGVGRKTANVVLGNAFNKNIGIVVDTHVTRLSERFGLTRETDAVKIERDLMPLFPPEQWTMVSHLLIEHGRQICVARAPRCEVCPLNDICPSSRV